MIKKLGKIGYNGLTLPFNHPLIKPTLACNFGCPFCYSSCAHGRRMSLLVLFFLTWKFIKNQPLQNPYVFFDWQGGEPTLLGINFFRRAVRWQKRLAGNKIIVANSLQTNGYLLDKQWAEFFQINHWKVGISLNGPAFIHDQWRQTKNGQNTHTHIAEGIKILQEYEVPFDVLTLVTAQNVSYPEEIYNHLTNEMGVRSIRIIPLAEANRLGQPDNYSLTGEQWGKFLLKLFDVWQKNGQGKIKINLFEMIADPLNNRFCFYSTFCAPSGPVVLPNGDMFACDFQTSPPFRLGNIIWSNPQKMAVSPKRLTFMRAKAENLPEECQKCHYQKYCHADCPKTRLLTTADGRQKSILCKGWKMFFAHALPYFQRLSPSPPS